MRDHLLDQRYRIKSQLGEGGMATIYLAVDEKLGRRVAVKILHPHLCRNQEIRKRFQQEARAISSIDHPSVIKIYDFSGDHSDQLWIVTEILTGVNLGQYVSKAPRRLLHPIIATLVVREICRGLEEAHNNGIIHRDVKPDNVMILTVGHVKLMDFGIAKDVHNQNITLTGSFMGSPSYMSPEQIRGKGIDQRSDIYSLSVLFYEIVTGLMPFTGNTTPDVVNNIMNGKFIPPKKIISNIPNILNDIIVTGMRFEKSDRIGIVEKYAQTLDDYLHDNGFAESSIELERFFKRPRKFENRLRKLGLEQRHAEREPQKTYQFGASPPRKTQVGKKTTYIQGRPSDLSTATQSRRQNRQRSTRATRFDEESQVRKRTNPRTIAGRQGRSQGLTSRTSFFVRILGFFSLGAIFFLSAWGVLSLMESISQDNQVIQKNSNRYSPEKRSFKKEKPALIREPTVKERTKTTQSRPVKAIQSKRYTEPKRKPSRLIRPKETSRQTVSPITRTRRYEKIPTKVSRPGKIFIEAKPAAKIFIDNKSYGVSNDSNIRRNGIEVPVGQHVIELKRSGYADLRANVLVNSGDQKKVKLSLKKVDEKKRFLIRVSKYPALASIQGLSKKYAEEFKIRSKSKAIDLFPGRYNIKVTYGKQKIQRKVEITENGNQLVFNAEFR